MSAKNLHMRRWCLSQVTFRKELFKPLRLALTGCGHGPEMKALLPLMGRERVQARLGGETA